jgi:transposase
MSGDLSAIQQLRFKAVKLHGEHYAEKEIARKCKMDVPWVRKALRRFNELGHFGNRPGQGRKEKLTDSDRTRLVKKVKGKQRQSTRKTANTFKTKKGQSLSPETIRVALKSSGLYPHKKQKTPRLTEKQKQKRVEFAKKNHRRDWDHAVFWDEKEFELFGPPNKKNDVIWDEHCAQYTQGEVAHPAKYKIGAAISSRGATRLVPYEGTIDSTKYQKMIAEVLPDIKKMYPDNDWCLVQDSARPHASKASQAWLAKKVPSIIPPKEWAANSPDISAVENVFGDQQEKVYEKGPKTLAELKRIVNSEWKKLTPEKCKKFVSAVPPRLQKIIETGGEYVLK